MASELLAQGGGAPGDEGEELSEGFVLRFEELDVADLDGELGEDVALDDDGV